MGIIKKIFYPSIIPRLKKRIEASRINSQFKRVLVADAGILTIHFWAPSFKWCISIGNVSEIYRDAQLLSLPQQLAIFVTGLLFSRFSFCIVPKNYNLFGVNAFMSMTAGWQLCRIAKYKYEHSLQKKEK